MPEVVYTYMVEEEEGKQLDWKCCFCKRTYEKLHAYMRKIEAQQSELLERQGVLEIELYEVKVMGKTKDIEHGVGNVEGKMVDLEEQ